ncbi:MAG: helix-turn-helix transcriptional regulator [Lachnospiraceae bacterium]|nr:helix-turn-helix transcriptional regulator [Lachnospiraceae bacterium]
MNNLVIAKKLIELRGDRTQAQIAKAIGVSPSAYSMYEVGQRIPRDEIKVKIARFYKKSVQSIFFNDEATNSEQKEAL